MRMRYSAEDLLIRPVDAPEDPDLILNISPELAGWEFISFQVRKLDQGNPYPAGNPGKTACKKNAGKPGENFRTGKR